MNRISKAWIFALLMSPALTSCGDSNPTGPGSDLVGSWRVLSDSNNNLDLSKVDFTLIFASSGTLTMKLDTKDSVIQFEFSGTWAMIQGQLVISLIFDGETTVSKGEYSIRGSQLTIIYDDGVVEVYRRL